MKLSLGAAVVAALVLAASACGSSHPVTSPPAPSRTVSALILGHTVRCAATLTTTVQAGHELGITFTFRNVSKRTAKVELGYGGMWVVVKSPDGTTYDTRVPLENERGPYIPPTPLAPGATKTEHLRYLRVRWEGPLQITPGCGLTQLPPVRVAVTSPGLPSSATAAVNEVVAASGHLLAHCRPRTPGVSVVGRIDPPSGTAPPLQTRCSIGLRRERGFYVAQLLIVTPPDLTGVHLDPTYEALTGPDVRNENTQAIAWQFVVTQRGAMSIYSASNESVRSGGGVAPDWTWSRSGPHAAGNGKCGFGGGGFGPSGPDVYFISGCGR